MACVPVFFQPSGSDSQLIYGLMICFVSFGAYVHFDPYEDRGNDAVARLCQMQIFFSLLASVALTSASEQNAGSNMDILLVVLYCLPVRLPLHSLGCSPLTPASVMPINAGWAGDISREPAAQDGKDAPSAIDAAKSKGHGQLRQDGQSGLQSECCTCSQGEGPCIKEGVKGHL